MSWLLFGQIVGLMFIATLLAMVLIDKWKGKLK